MVFLSFILECGKFLINNFHANQLTGFYMREKLVVNELRLL